MVAFNNILVPTDFSDYASLAVEYGASLAEKYGAQVHLLHVLETHYSATPTFAAGLALTSQVKESQEAAEKMLRDLAAGRPMVCKTAEGSAFLEILRYAENQEIDLIVMGTHGRTGLEHVLIGSVAERIVRKSSCPVMTIRDPRHRFVMPFDKVQ
ncbi:MAG: universal stress protein [bacterium]|nr:universal stress protein [bacterium]